MLYSMLYLVKISKKNISKVLMYQTWSLISAAPNNNRKVIKIKAKN
jgi:hypothetical protein